MASMTVMENIRTHEVFKHGLLMSQQVINNGLPSNKANMTGQRIRHRRDICTDMRHQGTDAFVFIRVDWFLGQVIFSQHWFHLEAPVGQIHSSGCRYALHPRHHGQKRGAPDSQTIYVEIKRKFCFHQVKAKRREAEVWHPIQTLTSCGAQFYIFVSGLHLNNIYPINTLTWEHRRHPWWRRGGPWRAQRPLSSRPFWYMHTHSDCSAAELLPQSWACCRH